MALGTLSVQLEANIAQFSNAMEQAAAVAQRHMRGVEAAANIARGALGALAAGFSLAALNGLTNEAIEAAGALDDLAESAGASVESLSGFSKLAREGGHDVGAMSDAMARLAKGMAGADDEMKGAGYALNYLGVSAKDSSGNLRSTDAVMIDVAKRLADFENGAGKAAIAQELFGKSGAALLPFLADLAQAGELNATTTAKQAAEAERYQKTLAKLEEAKRDLVRSIVSELLPGMQGLAGAFLASKTEAGGLQDKVKGLAESGSLKSFGRDGAMALAFVVDAGRGVGAVFQMVGQTLASGALQVAAYARTVEGALLVFSGRVIEGSAKIREGLSGVTVAGRDWVAEMNAILSQSQFRDKLQAQFRADDLKAEFDGLASAFGIGMERLNYVSSSAAAKAAEAALAAGKKLTAEQKKAWAELSREWIKFIDEGQAREAQLSMFLHKNAEDRTRDEKRAYEEWSAAWVAKIDFDKKKYEDGLREMAGMSKSHIELEEKQWAGWLSGIESGFRDVWTQSLSQSGNTWKRFVDGLWNAFKRGFLDLVYQSLAKPVFLNLVASVANSVGATALGNVATNTAASGGSNSLLSTGISAAANWTGISAAGSAFWGGFTGSIPAAAIGADAVAAGVGIQSGAASLGSSLSGVYSALSAIPVWGWIAMAVIAIGAVIAGRHKGGDKIGGSFMGAYDSEGNFLGERSVPGTDNGRFYTPSQMDSDVRSLVDGIGQGYATYLRRMGGTSGGFSFGLGLDHDPQGTARSRVSSMVTDASGRVVYSVNAREMDDKEVPDALQLEASRAILAALQASELPPLVAKFIRGLTASTATGAQIDKYLMAGSALKGFLDLMERDPIGDALEQFEAGQNGIMRAVRGNETAMQAAIDAFDGSADSVISLTNATNAYYNSQVALIAKIKEIAAAVKDLFNDSMEKYKLAGLDKQGQYNYFQEQAQFWYDKMMAATDPEDIRRYAERVNNYQTRAWDLLSPEEQAAMWQGFWAGADKVNRDVQDRLAETQTRIAQDTKDRMDKIYAALEKAGEDAQGAADTQNEAAGTFSNAVDRLVNTGVPVRVSSDRGEVTV